MNQRLAMIVLLAAQLPQHNKSDDPDLPGNLPRMIRWGSLRTEPSYLFILHKLRWENRRASLCDLQNPRQSTRRLDESWQQWMRLNPMLTIASLFFCQMVSWSFSSSLK